MERFCGHLKHGGAASKQFPYKSLDTYTFDWTVLWYLGAVYDIRDALKLKGEKKARGGSGNDDSRLEIPGGEFEKSHSFSVRSHNHTDNGCVLMARRPLLAPTTSDIFPLVLEGVVRKFPQLQVDWHVMAWRVWDALAAATFSEWTRFTKSNSQDVFRSASQCSQKTGARNAQYARVKSLSLVQSQAISHHYSVRGFRHTVVSTNQ